MVAISDVCTFSYPPDGSPVSAGSEGSLSAPLSETRSGFQILKNVSCVSLRPQGRSRREGHLIRISPDNLLNILQLCAPIGSYTSPLVTSRTRLYSVWDLYGSGTRRGLSSCSSNLSKTAPAPHRASQGYLAGCSTSIHAPTMLGARLGLRLVTALLGEMWPQLWPSPAPISCLPPYVYSTERAESKSSHAYYLKVYARYHYP